MPNFSDLLKRTALFAPLAILTFIATTAPVVAQEFSFDLGPEAGPLTGRILQIIALVTVIAIAPSLLIVMTSFTRIVVV